MIILKSEVGDYIYLDVVTQYSRSFKSQVSSHPVDGSGIVTDHVTKQNPRIQVVGSITGADFNFSKPRLSPEDRKFIGITQLVVPSEIASAVYVEGENSPLDLAPDIAGQFFSDTVPQLKNLSEGRDALYSEKLLYSILKSFYTNKTKLTLYEFDENSVDTSPLEDVFITSLNINETVSSGDAFQFDITFEKVTFSNLVEEELPEEVQVNLKKKADEEVDNGGESGDVENVPRDADYRSFLDALFGVDLGVL